MQRELADDAPWKRIQQNTFTRWANEHLKLVNRHIDDLQSELSDGLNLIALIEVLSQKKVPRHNKRPNFRSQKLENVSVVLDFLENVERIRLVNIGKFILPIAYSVVKRFLLGKRNVLETSV
jgi:filamin